MAPMWVLSGAHNESELGEQAHKVGTVGRYSAGPFPHGSVLVLLGDLSKYTTIQMFFLPYLFNKSEASQLVEIVFWPLDRFVQCP